MAKLNLTNIVDELKKKYSNYVNSPFIQKYNQKINQPIYNATNAILNKGANIPRFQVSRDLIGKAIPATKTPVGQFVTGAALAIPESIANIPRNLTVGYSRLQKENMDQMNAVLNQKKRSVNFQNIAAGVAPLAEAGLDMASFGTASSIARAGGKEVLKRGVGQAFKKGAISGSLYGGAGGLAYGVGEQYNKKFNAGEVVGSTLMGGSLGGLLGGTVGGLGAIKRLVKYNKDVLLQLRNAKGQWMKGSNPIKPPGMSQAQWDFQIKFNKTWNRNPYEPVFSSDLQQAIKVEAERRAPALQVRDINKDKIRGGIPTDTLGIRGGGRGMKTLEESGALKLNDPQAGFGGTRVTPVEPKAKIATSFPTQTTQPKPTVLQNVDSLPVPKSQQTPTVQTPEVGQLKKQLKSGEINDHTVEDGTYKFNILDRLYTEFVDRFHPLSKLAGKSGKNAELNRKLAGYYGSGSTADYHLNYELSPILKGQNIDDVRAASIAMRDVELNNRGIKGSPNQANAQKVLAELKAKYGDEGMKKLGETLNQLYKYQDGVARRYLVDTGIMSKESYGGMRSDNSFYVPFKRVQDKVDEFLGIPVKKGAGSVGSQNVVYKIKGSNKEVIDPIQSIVENTYKMVSLGRRQELAQTISGLSKTMPELVKKTNITGMKDTISVFENGKKVNYLVPTEVADAARGMSEESLVTLVKILKVPTDLFRTMTTGINPEFLLPNVSRDVQSAMFNTGINPIKWVAGLFHYAKQDKVYQDFLKAGGKISRVSINRPFLKQTAEEVAGKGFKIKSPKDIVRGLEMLSQYSEQPTRIMVFKDAYKKALKSGLSQEDALSEAAYWAQEGTVNFARRGSKMPNINAIYAYLNARIQGIDRMVRTVKNEPGKATLRYGVAFLAPSLALYAWNSKNPDYYDPRILSERDKQDNFIFMLPKPVGEVRYLKIPKAEVGKIVNPIEESLDWVRGKGGDVWKSIGSVLKSFSPIDNWGGVIPTAINPLVENAFNKDFYTGYDLVPEYKKNYPKGYQDSFYTGPMYRFAGQKLNVSPAKLQNLVEGYGGGAMRIVDNIAGKILPDKYTTAKNEQGADINRTPILRRFMGGEKKTVMEQMKANESRVNAINFDINDIKAGVKRGDIPMDVGVKKIEELQKQQKDIVNSTDTTTTEQTNGQSLRWIQTSDGALKQIDFNFTVPELKLTGNDTLDKEIKSDYNGEITKLKNDVILALDAGEISQDEAIKQLEKLNAAKSTKAKKPKKITLKVTKYKAPKITLKKKTTLKLPTLKVKKPKKIKIVRRYTIR